MKNWIDGIKMFYDSRATRQRERKKLIVVIKTLILITLNLIYNNLLALSEREKDSILFANTIKMISIKPQDPGKRDDIIASNIIDLVYKTHDTIVSVEDKLDLIFLMNKYEVYAFREFCNKVTWAFSIDSAIQQSNELLLIPLCNCQFAVKPILSQMLPLDSVALSKKIETMSVNYKGFYTALISRVIKRSKTPIKDKKDYFIEYEELLLPLEPYYKRKFPPLFK